MAARRPDARAVVAAVRRASPPRYRVATYAELESLSNRLANGLVATGIGAGVRTLLMVRPSVEFVALVYALFKARAIPVLIDPGMGLRRMLRCIRTVEPEALIGIPQVHAVRVLLRPAALACVQHVVTVGRRWFWGGPTLDTLCQGLQSAERSSDEFDIAPTEPDETAAILFTSGATGPAKGVVYTHATFDAQVRSIRDCYGFEPGDVDLAAFPLFALFGPALGLTSFIPDMDASRPARADPAKIVQAVNDHRAVSAFGSPAIWKNVAEYCHKQGVRLPTLRRVLIAGAPVSWRLLEKLHAVLDADADIHTPYGATEALPVASITGREVLTDCRDRSRQGAGTCVGRPLPGVEVRIIRITDGPIPCWSDDLLLPPGEIGEVVVRGPVVTREYFNIPGANESSKIADGLTVWHRMGDVGYLDDQGRLWFCGRKAQRVTGHGTMFTVPCEAIFNEHPDVFRSALVGVGPPGAQRPIVIVEPEPGRVTSRLGRLRLHTELLDRAKGSALTRDIGHVLIRRNFPVDPRHNVKINREELARWAAGRIR